MMEGISVGGMTLTNDGVGGHECMNDNDIISTIIDHSHSLFT